MNLSVVLDDHILGVLPYIIIVPLILLCSQQKSPDPDESAHVIEEGNVTWKGNNAPQNIRRHPWYFLAYIIEIFALSGAVATADDPSAAIATIQSAATFSSEHPIKYLFKTEGAGGQVGELYYPPAGQVQLGRAYSTGLTRSR